MRTTLQAQAIFCRRRPQPSRPPLANIKPGSPVPTWGMGTATGPPGIVLVEPAKPYPLELVSSDSNVHFRYQRAQLRVTATSKVCQRAKKPLGVGRIQRPAIRKTGFMEYWHGVRGSVPAIQHLRLRASRHTI